MSTKSAIAYLRVSTDEQTVQNQQLAIQQYATSNGYNVYYFFRDEATSGRIPVKNRKGFSEMLHHLEFTDKKPSAVFIYELSRVGRSFWDTLEAVKIVEEYAPLISVSPKESFLQTTDPTLRKLLISILTWVAERERDVLAQRTKDGLTRARSNGKVLGRPKLVINVTELAEMLSSGMTPREIARHLSINHMTVRKAIGIYARCS